MNTQLMKFIDNSPSCFHAVDNLASMLKEKGFIHLKESETWTLERGQKYYVTRNQSSIFAFSIGEDPSNYHYQITSSHSDSPAFKVKEVGELEAKSGYLQLNVEGYGGMICASWMDRPLSLAGRVLVQKEGKVTSHLFDIDKDILMICNVPIHMERTHNSGYAYNIQVDMLPMLSAQEGNEGMYQQMIADTLQVKEEDIMGKDLFLYNRAKGCIWGYHDEFISAPKIDDLQCAFASFKALSECTHTSGIQVAVCFDNEEVGSLTKQGADSTFMEDILKRINHCLGYSEEAYYCAISKSIMVSCDNAHALHPNHPEKYDAKNYVRMNQGVVIKHNANQKYTTDAFSSSVFEMICKRAGVPVQHYANRSDVAGGSTLGNLSNAHVSLHCVDVGLAQLAMHSSYETAGSKDVEHLIKALVTFYNSEIVVEGSHSFTIQ